jgi:sugar/nucleoside kinase (ribokinase family)
MARVLCIGDVMLDVIAVIETKINYGSDTPSKISTHGGGAAGNVASWSQVSGAPTKILARVGNDSAGTAVMSEFDELKIEHGDCVVAGAQTGVVVVLVDPSGERTMFPETGANSGLSLKDLPDLQGIEVVYLSGYALLDEASRPGVLDIISEIRGAGIPIFFDPATVGGMSQVDTVEIKSWLPLMNALFMNEEEATFLTGFTNLDAALDELLRLAPIAIIKCGSEGAIGKARGRESIRISALPTRVVDTTGAGDSFAGGFVATWLDNHDLMTCMEAGAAAAAQCVSIVGARPHVTPAH